MSNSFIANLESPAVVFVNPVSGRGKALAYMPSVRRLFEEQNIPAEFIVTDSAAEMAVRACSALAEGRQFLVAMGGDGTVQELANAIYGADSNAVLGVLPVGGGNDFAAALQMPKDPLEAARIMLRGSVRQIDLLRVHTADGRERLCVGGGGIGLDAEAARYANSLFRRVPGRLRYVLSALLALRKFKPFNVHVEFPGSELPHIETKTLVTAILNTPSYGAGVRLAPDAVIDDGLLALVLVGDLGMREVLKVLPRLLMKGELHTSRVRRVSARKVRLSTGKPCEFHGDGDILGPAPVEVEVVPRAIRVLAPTQQLA